MWDTILPGVWDTILPGVRGHYSPWCVGHYSPWCVGTLFSLVCAVIVLAGVRVRDLLFHDQLSNLLFGGFRCVVDTRHT